MYSRLSRRSLALLVLPALGLAAPTSAFSQITSESYLCSGNMERHYVAQLNGNYVHLYFLRAASGKQSYAQFPGDSRKFAIRFAPNSAAIADPIPRNQQDRVNGNQPPETAFGGRQGPGYVGVDWDYRHRIVFWIDFPMTPTNFQDDNRIDAHLMTQTGNNFAGIGWQLLGSSTWTPVPFMATFHHCF